MPAAVLAAHVPAMAVDVLDPVSEPLAHDVELRPLYRVQVLRLFSDFITGQLGLRQPQLDHGVSEPRNTVLVGRYAWLKLCRQRFSQAATPGPQLSASNAELPAGGSKLGGLIVGQP
jgi:hypothetical protein